MSAPTAGCIWQSVPIIGSARFWTTELFKELNPDIVPNDVLHFPDYQEKLAAASVKTGLKEAAVTAIGRIGGVQAVVAVLDSRVFYGQHEHRCW